MFNTTNIYGNETIRYKNDAQDHLYPFYKDVPNIIQCNQKKNIYINKVCRNNKLLKLFDLVSKANVYAYENATKKEVNHYTFNKKYLHINLKSYFKKGQLDTDKLAFNLKKKLMDLLGGDSKYKEIKLFHTSYIAEENNNGIVLSAQNGNKIYLGKSCDVLDSSNNKGTWYCRKDKCHVMLGNHTDFFDISDITEKYKCKKDIRTMQIQKIHRILKTL